MPPQTPIIPLADKGPGSYEYWRTQLDWSSEIRRDKLKGWRTNAKAYADLLKPSHAEGVRVNIEFEKTEQKRWQLFFRQPAIRLRPHPRTIRDSAQLDPQTGQPARDLKRATAIFREVVSQISGESHARLKYLMDEVIFDVLCPSGIGFVKIGYERYIQGTRQVATGEKQADPNYAPQTGNILNIRPVPLVDVMATVPNTISERYYASRISPARALVPAEFGQSDYTKAPFLGYDFDILPADADRRGWPVNPNQGRDFKTDDDDRIMELDKKGNKTHMIPCRCIYYYPLLVDGSDPNPDRIRTLIFVGNSKEPVVHTNYKDQVFDQRGRFQMGLKTLPIEVLTLRYVSDTAYPPSDCTITRSQSDELSEYRTTMKFHRRRAIPMYTVDIHGILDERVKEQIRAGTWNWLDYIPTDGPGDRFIQAVQLASYPQDNYRANDYFMNDVNRAWALGANQSGVTEKGSATATEIASIQQATANRLGGEREKVSVQFYCGLLAKLGALLQLYADEEQYVEIVGETGAKELAAWDKHTIRGEFLYDVVPNSALAPDAAADQDQALNIFNLARNDPYTNGEQLLRRTYEAYGVEDIDRLVQQPPPPAPPPEKHSVTLAINGKDLDPSAPQYANVIEVIRAAGIAMPQAAPPGAAPVTPANVVDRERMRMAAADNADQRAGGLVGVGIGAHP